MFQTTRNIILALAVTALLGCASSPSSKSASSSQNDLAAAARLIQENKSDDAMDILQKLRKRLPESADVMRLYVEAAFRGGKINELIDSLERELELAPNSPCLNYGLGISLYAQSAAQEQKALTYLEQAAAARPDSAEFMFRIGLIHLDAERFDQALAALKRARDLDPKASRHHISLAQAQARTGDRKGALDSLRAVLDLSPRPTDLKVAEKVISHLNLPFREVPKVVADEFERGLNFMQVDAPQQAMVTFQEILQKFPDLAGVHAALGLCFERIDDASRAIEELRYAIELSPNDPLNHMYLADVYFAKERYDKAADGYKKVIEQDPLNTHAYERLGQMALQISDFQNAVSHYRRLITLKPKDQGARIAYGAALTGSGDLDGAESVYAGLLKDNSKNVEVLMRMGLLFLERRKIQEGNPEKSRELSAEAAKWFEKVLDIQPHNVLAARMLQSLAQGN